MTIRRPNRRHVPEIEAHVAGTLCPVTGKRRYQTEFTAEQGRKAVARRDPDRDRAAQLHVYRCSSCLDLHIGHST
jgi:hypothetical protein